MRGLALTPEDRTVVRNQFQMGRCHPFKDMGDPSITRCGSEPSCSIRCRMDQRGDILTSIPLSFCLDPQLQFALLSGHPDAILGLSSTMVTGGTSCSQGCREATPVEEQNDVCGICTSGLVWNLAESGMDLVGTE